MGMIRNVMITITALIPFLRNKIFADKKFKSIPLPKDEII